MARNQKDPKGNETNMNANLIFFSRFTLSRNVARHVGIFLCGNSNFTSDGPIAHITQHLKVQEMDVTDISISVFQPLMTQSWAKTIPKKIVAWQLFFSPSLAGLSQNPKAYRAACSTAAFCSVAAVFFPFLGGPDSTQMGLNWMPRVLAPISERLHTSQSLPLNSGL